MKQYRFRYEIEYTVEAEDEEDAIYQLFDLMKRDWIEYLDNGELVELETPIGGK